MLIEIPKNLFELFTSQLTQEKNKQIKAGRTYGADVISIDHSRLDEETLEILHQLTRSNMEEYRGLSMTLTTLKRILSDPNTACIGRLSLLEAAIIEFLKQDLIDGWLYDFTDPNTPVPYVVQSVKYQPARIRQDTPCVILKLAANRFGTLEKTEITFFPDDVVKQTVIEILARKNLHHETSELKAEYTQQLAKYTTWKPRLHAQFLSQGFGVIHAARYTSEKIQLHSGKIPGRVVNDEDSLSKSTIVLDSSPDFWRGIQVDSGFDEMPFHPFILCFHLTLHENIWIHVNSLKPYTYQPDLRKKLVLPSTHSDLIDILTTDMNVLLEDIVPGKSGGTAILCQGLPGLGKTLTAEIYAEVIQRPLYRVHSGQLGITAIEIEKKLEQILKRASRWKAVLLLDEADVYICQRNTDMSHNAIVAAFLKTLEYFDGLLFLTTNRINDIDDAILSRCVAIVSYELPDAMQRSRLWKILADQFGIQLSDELIKKLVIIFPEITGRDIKFLLKLASKYSRHRNLPYTEELFQKCAMFRGVNQSPQSSQSLGD